MSLKIKIRVLSWKIQHKISHVPSFMPIIPEAILAIGRGGPETTLWVWPIQKELVDKKLVILCLQINLTWWIKLSFVQNTVDNTLWRGFWTLCEYKLRKVVSTTCWGVTLRELCPPLSRFLEWPLHPTRELYAKIWSAEALWLDDSKKGGNKDDFFAEGFLLSTQCKTPLWPKWAPLRKAPVGELVLFVKQL